MYARTPSNLEDNEITTYLPNGMTMREWRARVDLASSAHGPRALRLADAVVDIAKAAGGTWQGTTRELRELLQDRPELQGDNIRNVRDLPHRLRTGSFLRAVLDIHRYEVKSGRVAYTWVISPE